MHGRRAEGGEGGGRRGAFVNMLSHRDDLLHGQAFWAKAAILRAQAPAVAEVGLHAVLAVRRASSAPASLSAALAKAVATDASGLSVLATFVLVRVGVRVAARGPLVDAFGQPIRKEWR